MEPDKPLVTVLGASGFLGAAVTAVLAHAPVRLRLVSRRPLPAGLLPRDSDARTAELSDPASLAAAVAGSDAVVHLVALHAGAMNWRITDDADSRRITVGLVRDLVGALDRDAPPDRPRVCVFAGTTTQAGPPGSGRLDGSETDEPRTGYDAQKLAAERVLMSASAAGAVRGISLRLPMVYGASPGPAGAGRGVVAAMARKALDGVPLTMWHNGDVRRDLLYVDDAARAFALALAHPDSLAGRHWVVGTGTGVRVADLFTTIAELVAARTGAPPVPVCSVAPPEGAAAMDFQSYTIDAGAYRAATGWRPRVELREGLTRTIDVLKS